MLALLFNPNTRDRWYVEATCNEDSKEFISRVKFCFPEWQITIVEKANSYNV